MNNLVAYKERLLPVLKRSDILNDIDAARNDYGKLLMPELLAAEEALGKTRDAHLNKMFDSLVRIAKLPRSGSPIKGLQGALGEVEKSLDKVQDMIKHDFAGEQIATESMTYRQVALLRYVEIARFAFEYTLRFLRYAYMVELNAAGQKDNDIITKNELKALTDQFESFANSVMVLAQEPAKIEKALKETPNIVVDEKTSDALSFTSGGKADPTRSDFILFNLKWNPIYRVRLLIADFQARKYRKAKEELRMFEIQRLRIENARKGRADPILDKQANELTGIINELQHDINQMEKSYA